MEKVMPFENNSLMDELSSDQTSYLCQGTIFREFVNKEIKQFSLKKNPTTLRGFGELLLLQGTDHEIDDQRLIWVNSDSCFGSTNLSRLLLFEKDAYRLTFILSIELSKASCNSRTDTFDVCSETEVGALSALEIIFNTTDDYYTEMSICNCAVMFPGELQCPFDRQLEAIFCQNPSRRQFDFAYLNFRSHDFGRVLPTSGKAINLRFAVCSFDDDGESFTQDFGTMLDNIDGTPSAKLEFKSTFPEYVIYNMDNRYKKLHLKFESIEFSIEQSRALASAEIRKLELYDCAFDEADGGQSLVDSVRAGRGPRGLSLGSSDDGTIFDTDVRLMSFITALQDNEHLESLTLRDSVSEDLDCTKALADALRQNTTLTHLGCCFYDFEDKESWIPLFDAITIHPTLRTLELSNVNGEPDDLTPALIDMTRTNRVLDLEEIDCHDSDI